MSVKGFFIIMVIMHSSYVFSSDEEQLLVPRTTFTMVSCCDTFFHKKNYPTLLFAGSIGGAIIGGVGAYACGDYCVSSFPFNATTPAVAFFGNVIFGTVMEVAGGGVMGAGLSGVVIGLHKLVTHYRGVFYNTTTTTSE